MTGHGTTRTARGAAHAAAALAGLLAAGAALAAAELAAAAVRPEAGPVAAVGAAVVDATPPGVAAWAVRAFGEADKPLLLTGVLVLLALCAAALGLLARRRRRAGAAGVLLFGVLGTAAALTRPDAGPADALPSAAGAAAGACVLFVLASRLPGAPGVPGVPGAGTGGGSSDTGTGAGTGTGQPSGSAAPRPSAPPAPSGTPGPSAPFDRRGFAFAATVTAVAAAGTAAAGRRLQSARRARAAASRADIALPAPVSPAPPLPRGTDLRVPGLSPFRTPNRDFYRVDTALVVPRIDAGDWRLRLHGAGVEKPLTLRYADLLDRELIERDITLTCVSNQVGGPYAGTARWLGVPLAGLLREAGVRPPSGGGPADQLIARSRDGMTFGTPVETVMDGRDALLAVGMNGEPLPFRHGFPVRMVVPGLYGYVSACKWLTELELTTFDAFDPYWVRRNWARRAPVKTQSRIDTPRGLARPAPGTVRVAGVAWAQHRGIARVEVRVDDGPWHRAELAPSPSPDTWRQWVWDWQAAPGRHRLTVRATDGDGATQTAQRTGTVPDGATGRHSVVVTVT